MLNLINSLFVSNDTDIGPDLLEAYPWLACVRFAVGNCKSPPDDIEDSLYSATTHFERTHNQQTAKDYIAQTKEQKLIFNLIKIAEFFSISDEETSQSIVDSESQLVKLLFKQYEENETRPKQRNNKINWPTIDFGQQIALNPNGVGSPTKSQLKSLEGNIKLIIEFCKLVQKNRAS